MSQTNDVLAFGEIDRSRVALVGGKGAHLGELSRIEGVPVPAGFCVTTDAFRRFMAQVPDFDAALDRLARLAVDDRAAINAQSAELRALLEATPIPADLAAAVLRSLDQLGAHHAYAVRSSATAEDSATASFAGQQDSYLNIVDADAILAHIRRCWASLFTARAVTYRQRTGIEHRQVQMAVVVQRMVVPSVAGILFTADPITGHRKATSIEASFGLGEALVSGLVNPDVYTVRDGAVTARTIGAKQRAITAQPDGGTQEAAIAPERQTQPALTDTQAVRLAALGRRIEAHFGCPQDIEWCLTDDDNVWIVQSRPITTLFPIPAADDDATHVYISVGHQQMMTDAMTPLGLSMWQMATARPMAEAGGRLFVDVAAVLASPKTRDGFLAMLGRSDPLIGDALQTVIERDDIITPLPDDSADGPPPPPGSAPADPIATDPAIVTALIEHSQSSIATLEQEIQGKSGPELFDFIVADLQELRRRLFDPQSHRAIMAGMEATWWLNEHLPQWLGEAYRNASDTLTQSVPHNVTSEMGLALLDVADVIRPYPDVVAFLEQVTDDGFLDETSRLDGGPAASDAIQSWLDRYGMRGVGEIDIARPRWRERPTMLLPIILGNVRNFPPGEAKRRFAQGLREARATEQEVLVRLRTVPDGKAKATETKGMIDRVRTFSGYREYPKYAKISREFVYKQALLAEAQRLVQAGVLRAVDDIFFLRFEELHEVVRTQQVDALLIDQRREEFRTYQALTPPRVFTSEGEIVTGAYCRGDLPPGALAGLAVSAGVVEGRARVVRDIAAADLAAGDILVTAFTDPSWTPLFVTIGGLVTEVGGLMTHGAVIAREYGLPAVVGVESATRTIRDGQRIRVNGTDGYVEILACD